MSTFSYVATASTNLASVRPLPTVLKAWSMVNTSAATRWVRFYNNATAPVPATDAALIEWRMPLPAGQRSEVSFSSGGIWFPSNLSFDITAAAPDNDGTATAAGDVTLNLIFE
jgi:hypothetical protein